MREFKVPLVRSDAKREWFECNLSTIKKAINKVKYGIKGTKDFRMRDEQKTAHDKITNYFYNGGAEFLLAAKMRFGKNFTILNSIKTLGFQNILVITYKPQVFNSLKDDINEHVNFKEWNFIDLKKKKEKNGL